MVKETSPDQIITLHPVLQVGELAIRRVEEEDSVFNGMRQIINSTFHGRMGSHKERNQAPSAASYIHHYLPRHFLPGVITHDPWSLRCGSAT
jgi:ArsR family metal-binding transcriptional regulator